MVKLFMQSRLVQLVACFGLHLGVGRFDSWVSHILSLVVSYW